MPLEGWSVSNRRILFNSNCNAGIHHYQRHLRHYARYCCPHTALHYHHLLSLPVIHPMSLIHRHSTVHRHLTSLWRLTSSLHVKSHRPLCFTNLHHLLTFHHHFHRRNRRSRHMILHHHCFHGCHYCCRGRIDHHDFGRHHRSRQDHLLKVSLNHRCHSNLSRH